MTAEPASRLPAPRRAPSTAPPRPLTVVTSPGLPVLRPARTPFVGLVVVLIVAGLMALLTLNTALQQASFTVGRLERQAAALLDHEQALAQQVAVEEAPHRLAQRAAALGMVPSETPAFIRTADGTVVGVPTPADARAEVSVQAPPEVPIELPVPVPDVPVSDVPVSDVPVPDVPASDIPVPDVPVSDVPVPDVPPAGTSEAPGTGPPPSQPPVGEQPPTAGLAPVPAPAP